MIRTLPIVLACGVWAASASAQSLEDRIAAVRQQRLAAKAAEEAASTADPTRKILLALRRPLPDVDLRDLPAREAIEWLADASGVKIVVDWNRLGQEGIDSETPVNLRAGKASAERVLTLIAKQLVVDDPLIWEANPWYVELMTRSQANERTLVITYPIQDLLHEVPNFGAQAPTFDLAQLGQQSGQGFGGASGGGRGGGGSTLFSNSGNTAREDDRATRAERGEEIASLIRETIEPDLWRENGGDVASIRYYNGYLIVRAPMYVHMQIGGGRGISTTNTPAPVTHLGPDRRYVILNADISAAQVHEIRQVPYRAGAAGSRRYLSNPSDASIAPR